MEGVGEEGEEVEDSVGDEDPTVFLLRQNVYAWYLAVSPCPVHQCVWCDMPAVCGVLSLYCMYMYMYMVYNVCITACSVIYMTVQCMCAHTEME